MLAKRSLSIAGDENGKGFVACLRNALKSVESSKLELEVYDAQFRKEERGEGESLMDQAFAIVGSSPEEELKDCERRIRKFHELKEEFLAYPDLLKAIDTEITKLQERVSVSGFKTYNVELVEERITTQRVFAKNPKDGIRKALFKEGIVVDIDDSTTSKREPRIYQDGRRITQTELDAEE